MFRLFIALHIVELWVFAVEYIKCDEYYISSICYTKIQYLLSSN